MLQGWAAPARPSCAGNLLTRHGAGCSSYRRGRGRGPGPGATKWTARRPPAADPPSWRAGNGRPPRHGDRLCGTQGSSPSPAPQQTRGRRCAWRNGGCTVRSNATTHGHCQDRPHRTLATARQTGKVGTHNHSPRSKHFGDHIKPRGQGRPSARSSGEPVSHSRTLVLP